MIESRNVATVGERMRISSSQLGGARCAEDGFEVGLLQTAIVDNGASSPRVKSPCRDWLLFSRGLVQLNEHWFDFEH